MVLATALASLKRRRPRLRLATCGHWDAQHFLDAAAAHCEPDPA